MPRLIAFWGGLLALLAATPLYARRIYVPTDVPTIQQGIVRAAEGDTVLVEEGRYFENLQFGGRNIVLASRFALDGNLQHVFRTIIDGSRPQAADQASVVMFQGGETRRAVLEGFTITGGTGTVWPDEHGFGTYVEGGGVMIVRSSPTLRFNRIVGNRATRGCARCRSAGGGGVRAGDGAPLLEYNVIAENEGLYGGGVVSNFASVTLRHNVIAGNRVLATEAMETFGGGGLFFFGEGPQGPSLVEHTTIADNVVLSAAEGSNPFSGRGGGIVGETTSLLVRHSIVWGNRQTAGSAFARLPGLTLESSYNVWQDAPAPAGPGQQVADPRFLSAYRLAPTSPAVDAGNLTLQDPADAGSATQAAFPAQGTTRPDLGAYGGPGALRLPFAEMATGVADASRVLPLDFELSPSPARARVEVRLHVAQAGLATVDVLDLQGRRVARWFEQYVGIGPLVVVGAAEPLPAGRYIVRVSTAAGRATQLLVVA